ncbi:MAG: GumC family protein [Acetobacteraceae bacterium]
MQDVVDHREGLPSSGPQVRHFVAPEGRLEPLGVPLARFYAILRRHYLVVLITFALGVGAAVLVVSRMPKEYTAGASILIEPQRTQVSDLQAISPEFSDVTSLIRTQIDILRSPTLARNVVRTLGLENNPEFIGGSANVVATLSAALHGILDGLNPKKTPATRPTRIERAAAALSGKIGFSNEVRSSVLDVTVTTRSAELSAGIANELAKQYLDFKRREKFAAMQRTSDWLEAQLVGLSKQVHTEEIALQLYRTQHGLTDLPSRGTDGGSSATSITRQRLSDVARQLGDVSRDLARKEAELAQARIALRERRTDALPEVLISPVIVQLMSQQAVVDSREANLAASRGTNNPELIAVRAEAASLQGAIMQEMTKVVASLSTEVASARAQEQTLHRQMGQSVAAVGTENAAEVGLRSLADRARATRTIYESFLTRAAELANVGGIQEPDATLVSSATPPLGPSAPKSVRLILVAVVLSAVLGIGLACGVEGIRRGFSLPDELEACLGLPVMALLPRMSRGRHRRAARRLNEFVGSVNSLRGRLRAFDGNRPKVIVISSAMPREGKSVLAAAMATIAAASGWRVLLIECDFHCPSLAARLGVPPGPGLRETLAAGTTGAACSTAFEVQPRLDVIPAGHGGGDPQELLSSPRMVELIEKARECYQLVIIDTPPLLPVPDALALVPLADATVMVVRWEKTPRAAVQDAVQLLRDSRARFVGAVLTQVDLRTTARLGGRPAGLYDYYRQQEGKADVPRAS